MKPEFLKYHLTLCLALIASTLFAQDYTRYISKDDELFRQNNYEKKLESYLRNYLINEYPERSAKAWNKDYSSQYAFERSVDPNRERWRNKVLKPPALRKTGPLIRKPYKIGDLDAEWLELPLGGISAEAIFALPKGAKKNKPVPLIIVQHGNGSYPETTFENGPNYHAYATELVKAGYAVIALFNLRSIEKRNNIERLSRLADISLPGIEFSRMQNLLDVILEEPGIDKDRVGMWGLSYGGMATMFWMPLEPRIKTGIIAGWFNHRLEKMAVNDPKSYSSFALLKEENAFFTGWLTEFTDYDAISMLCPRPIQIQHGKKDNIANWPKMLEEYNKSKTDYIKLNIPDKIDLVLHEGGHESMPEQGIKFLNKWLK